MAPFREASLKNSAVVENSSSGCYSVNGFIYSGYKGSIATTLEALNDFLASVLL